MDDNTRVILVKKGSHVRKMFDRIALWYDFLNHFLSLGTDRRWRKKMLRQMDLNADSYVLDMATGTGDMAVTLVKKTGCRVTGLDVSEKMMAVGVEKVHKKKLGGNIHFVTGAAEKIPFPDHTFDVVTVAFGVRNFTDLEQGLREMLRVLKPAGRLAVLEFSQPEKQPLKVLYFFYLFHLLPLAGRIFSGDRQAYSYLPASIKAFPQRDSFVGILRRCGYKNTFFKTYNGGIVSAYFGEKPAG